MLFLSLQTTTRLTLSQALLACRQQPRSGAIPVRFLTLSLPTLQLTATDTSLNTTALVPPDVYETQYKVLYAVQTEAISENKYGYVSTGQERRREHAGSRLSDSIAILVVGFSHSGSRLWSSCRTQSSRLSTWHLNSIYLAPTASYLA